MPNSEGDFINMPMNDMGELFPQEEMNTSVNFVVTYFDGLPNYDVKSIKIVEINV